MRPKLLTGFEEDVYNGYLSYFTAYTNRNWDGMLKTFHPEITAVGTGIDEVKLSWEEIIEFYRREFEQAPEAMKYDITDVFVQKISSDSALLVLTCHMKYASLQQHFCVPNNRTTAIMKLSGGAWKLLHGHWSQPAEGQDIGESIPYKKLQEKNKNLEQIVLARTQQIQDQNEKLEKLNNTKNHLFSIIAHDLRSPFNSFLGLSEIMLLNYDKNYSEKDYFKNHLKIINQQALYLFTTADNLLNWAKKQIDEVSTNIQSCNITNIIDEQITTLSNLYHSKKLKIEKNFHPDLTFHSDPEILNIVLRNVITNAIKYSYEGNKILISVKINNSKLNIAIHDFGIGITDEQIENIMKSDSFVTSLQGTKNEKGTGIGLRLSMELLKTLNGSITIHRNTDKGTNVLIEIPENIPSSV